jgi:thiamine monophosphate synthase
MAWAQADLDALETAIKAGVRSVSYRDRSITYASMEEMLRLRDVMKSVVNVAAGSTTRCNYGSFSKG